MNICEHWSLHSCLFPQAKIANGGITETKGTNIVKALPCITTKFLRKVWILISSSLYMNVHLSTPVWHGWLSFLGNGIRVSIYKGFLNLKPGMFYHWKLSVLWSNTACTRSQIVHLKAIKGKLEISLIFPRCFKWSIFSCLFSFFLFNRIILLIHFVSRRHRLSSIAVKPKLDM